jgi:hypothetical protein
MLESRANLLFFFASQAVSVDKLNFFENLSTHKKEMADLCRMD